MSKLKQEERAVRGYVEFMREAVLAADRFRVAGIAMPARLAAFVGEPAPPDRCHWHGKVDGEVRGCCLELSPDRGRTEE